jgi:nucleotide-binding universal stress UspA family protein
MADVRGLTFSAARTYRLERVMERSEQPPGVGGGFFRNVVVGVDEHQGGRDAVALAEKLVAADGSMMCVRVLVRDALLARGPELKVNDVLAHDAREADRVLHVGRGSGPDQVRGFDAPSVGRGLHEVVDAKRADLLVIGSCRRGLLGRVMLGDETSEALNGAGCAVAVAPFGYADAQAVIREIGVAYDGSLDSTNALAVGRELAREHDARLSAFQAVAVPASLSFPGAGGLAQSVPGMVDEARARIAALGDVEPHAAYGVASEELAVFSASLGLLVVGSRGYGPAGRLIHGSTSRQLARTARCPLLVLTRDAGFRRSAVINDVRPAVVAAVS